MANILVLINEAARNTGTVNEHLSSFEKFSSNRIVLADFRIVTAMDFELHMFDCIVFHYSISIANPKYISKDLTERLKLFSGLKVLFIQDEMRWVNATCSKIKELGIKTIFTVVNKNIIRKIYRDPWFNNVRFEQTLTGFVPEELLDEPLIPYVSREIDVGYRARELPAWCGFFAQEKWQIGQRFKKDAKQYDLNCDISSHERDRIYGKKWIEFIKNSKATLGVESGSSFVDFTGEVLPSVELYKTQNPDASFEQIREKFLEGRDGEIIIHVISPRCFEAAALKTLMVMYEGEYSGVLVKNRHYLALNRDHSNMKNIVEIIKDPKKANVVIQAAYEEIACSNKWTFRTFIKRFDSVIDEEMIKQNINMQTRINQTSIADLQIEIKKRCQKYILYSKLGWFFSNLARRVYYCLDIVLPEPVKDPVIKRLTVLYYFGKKKLLSGFFG